MMFTYWTKKWSKYGLNAFSVKSKLFQVYILAGAFILLVHHRANYSIIFCPVALR